MNGTHPNRNWWRAWAVHASRAALLFAILGLIHIQQQRFRARQRVASLASLPAHHLKAVFPDAEKLGAAESHGGREVLAANGDKIGYLIQTAPASDAFIGFSGSTDLVIGFSPDDHIRGWTILHSGDTRDHVELVARNDRFLNAFIGHTWSEAAALDVDAVSGATLTSLSILQGLRERLGNTAKSLKFPDPLTLADARVFFPAAVTLAADDASPSLWPVRAADGQLLGNLLRTSPAADNVIGYQGPTDAYVAARPDGQIIGVRLSHSYDNEPYVDYVRDDAYFRDAFNVYQLAELAELDLKQAQVEGVSGATMTSLAMARGMVNAARAHQAAREQPRNGAVAADWRSVGTTAVVMTAMVLGFTRLRGYKWLRIGFELVLIGYLGLINGDLLSQALLVGWAQSGIPWRNGWGLVVLTVAALAVPLTTKYNLYCHHLCPHGAAQQLLRGRMRSGWKVPPRLARGLMVIRPILLLWVLLVAFCHWPFSLVDLEPFDAYLWRSAGWATTTIAVLGLLAACFVPLAYCRYACPTGAVLEYLRRQRLSHRWRWADGLALACLMLSALLVWADG